jgi:nucleoside-diphosphate-sugar epimerase
MLTVFGGHGFIGSQYVADYYDHAVGNIASVNTRADYEVHSKDVLYLIQPYSYAEVAGDSNLTLLTRVLDSWRRRSDSKNGVFNFVSSAKVYGNDRTFRHREDFPCKPEGFYSNIRYCAERLLTLYCAAYGLHYRILRVVNAVGANAPGTAEQNVLHFLLNKLAAGETVEVQGNGKFFRDYIHVEDCSRAIESVMTRGDANSIYNIGNGESQCFVDILEYAVRRLGKGKIVFVPQKAPPLSFSINTDKLKSLGYVPKYTGEALYEVILPCVN